MTNQEFLDTISIIIDEMEPFDIGYRYIKSVRVKSGNAVYEMSRSIFQTYVSTQIGKRVEFGFVLDQSRLAADVMNEFDTIMATIAAKCLY